ncbi:MAG: hypothetical protein AAFY71_08935 [Bacteroidota bacterium]
MMPRLVYALWAISMAIFIIGFLFKILNWPYEEEILLSGLIIWGVYLVLFFLDTLQKRKKLKLIAFLQRLFSQLGLSFLLIGYMLRIFHWPYDTIVIYAGMVIGLLYFGISFFVKEEEPDTEEEDSLIDQIGKKDSSVN